MGFEQKSFFPQILKRKSIYDERNLVTSVSSGFTLKYKNFILLNFNDVVIIWKQINNSYFFCPCRWYHDLNTKFFPVTKWMSFHANISSLYYSTRNTTLSHFKLNQISSIWDIRKNFSNQIFSSFNKLGFFWWTQIVTLGCVVEDSVHKNRGKWCCVEKYERFQLLKWFNLYGACIYSRSLGISPKN